MVSTPVAPAGRATPIRSKNLQARLRENTGLGNGRSRIRTTRRSPAIASGSTLRGHHEPSNIFVSRWPLLLSSAARAAAVFHRLARDRLKVRRSLRALRFRNTIVDNSDAHRKSSEIETPWKPPCG
jgi:hypothetical protein